jgi:hypothetical protein
MKKLSIVILMINITLTLFSQDLRVTVSQPQKADDRYANMITTGQIGNNIYVVTTNNKGKITLSSFDNNLKRQQEAVVVDKDGKKNGILDNELLYRWNSYLRDNVLFTQNNILMFFELFDKDDKSRVLLCQKLDLNCKYDGSLIAIDKIPASKKRNSGSFTIKMSEDSTKFLVLKQLPYEKNAEKEFTFTTYSTNLKKVADATIKLPYKDKDVAIYQPKVSDNGDVYFLVQIDKERKEKEKGEDDNFYMLNCLRLSANSKLVNYDLSLKGRDITGVSYYFDNKSTDVLCAGFYSDIKTTAKRTTDIDGFFYVKINRNTSSIITQETKEFPAALVNQIAGKNLDKKVKAGKGIPNTFNICDIFRNADGSMFMTAENNYSITICNRSGCYTTYYSNNILLIDMDKDGKIKGFYDIPKYQASDNSTFLYSTAMHKGNNIIFSYLDNPKNSEKNIENIKDVSKATNFRKAAVTFVRFKEGKVVREKLPLNKQTKLIAVPQYSVKIAEGIYIMPLTGKKQFGLIKVEM